jgi:DNA-binding phage protein
MADAALIEAKYHALSGWLDEATLRIWAAVEARSIGRGGVSMVAKAIGMSRTTIYAGLAELRIVSTNHSGNAWP